MQLNTNIYGPFYYAVYPLIIVFLLIVITIIVFLCLNIKRQKIDKSTSIVFIPKDINSIKNKYLNELDRLANNVNNLSKRKIYNKLSILIRKFTLEMTNIDVLKYTLNEIKTLKIDSLTELVTEYYEPEFSKESDANPIKSINKTKEIINKWK